MKQEIISVLRRVDLYDYPKIFKDHFFKNPKERRHEEKLLKFYSGLVKPGDLCFDIGASYGNRTAAFLKLGARVVSVEPQKIPAKFLKRKFKKKIILISKALGEAHGFNYMYVSDFTALSTLSYDWLMSVMDDRFNQIKWRKKIEVEVITLDELIREYGRPNFCKIDVEGYELEVLRGLTQPLENLSFEFTIPEFTERAMSCLNYLSSIGKIVCNYSAGETMEFGLPQWVTVTKFMGLF